MPRVYKFTDEDRARSRQKEKERRDRINSLPKEWKSEDKDITMAAFGYCCGYCGAPEHDVSLEFDHFIDIHEDNCPGTIIGNMVPSCRPCNRRKGNLGAHTILAPDKLAEVKSVLATLGGVF